MIINALFRISLGRSNFKCDRDNRTGIAMKKITTMMALMLAQQSYALQLEGINGVSILAIDGKKTESTFFSSNAGTELEAGEHQVVVRYSKRFANDGLVQSVPAIFNIDVQQDTQISIAHLNNPQRAKNAIRDGLAWNIITADKQYSIQEYASLKGEGFMPYSDIEGLVSAYNQQQNITVNGEPVTQIIAVETHASEVSIDLISLYQQATHEQKKAFRLWLVEQDMK